MRNSTNTKTLTTNLTFVDIVDDLIVGKKRIIHVSHKMTQFMSIEM